MPKVFVSKEQYLQFKEAEKALGIKLAKANAEYQLRVPDCVNGQHGVYQVLRCYPSGLKYIAELKLIEPTNSQEEALLKMMAFQRQKMTEGKLIIKVVD